MITLTKTSDLLTYSDADYKEAVNFTQSLYNDPITLNHNGVKYILPCGTSDHITVIKDGFFFYVIGENSGLSYIGLTVINTEEKAIDGEVFLRDEDINGNIDDLSFGVLDKDTDEQLRVLCAYL